jgi:predicted RNA binding protein YcfA (HicA-like mRNA interferase family)
MSPRTPRLTAKQIIKQLKNPGFIEIGQTGSHLKLFNQETRRTAIVPIHSSKIIPLGTTKAIEKQSGVQFI